MRPASRGGRCRPGCCRSAPSWSRSRACRSVPRRCRSAWPRHTSAPDLEALPLLAGPPLASAEPVEVECLPSGAEGRCRGAAGQPGRATPARQTLRRCRCWPGRRWRAPSRSRSSACLLALVAGAAALPVGLDTPHQCARPRGAAAAGRAAAGRCRARRGRRCAGRCRGAAGQPGHASAPGLEVLPLQPGRRPQTSCPVAAPMFVVTSWQFCLENCTHFPAVCQISNLNHHVFIMQISFTNSLHLRLTHSVRLGCRKRALSVVRAAARP